MSSRRKARVLAFQTLFSMEFNYLNLEQLIKFEWLDESHLKSLDEETILFTKLLVTGTVENLKEIDEVIKKQLQKWNFDRVVKVELAILRLSVYSILFQKDIPVTVTINEAIDIAKEFGADDAYKFINGVLDGLKKARKL